MDTKTLGEFIRSRRESMGLGLRQTAELIGCVAPYLSDIERGYRKAMQNRKLLDRIAEVLHLTEQEKLQMFILAVQGNEIANFVIESLAAKAELGDAALKAVEGLDCKRVDDKQCDRGDRYLWPSCNFRDFCRLRAGGGQG